jgi:hypothetical protein
MDHRDRRVTAFPKGFQRAVNMLLVVDPALRGVGASRLEFGNVGARSERIASRPPQHDAAQVIIS